MTRVMMRCRRQSQATYVISGILSLFDTQGLIDRKTSSSMYKASFLMHVPRADIATGFIGPEPTESNSDTDRFKMQIAEPRMLYPESLPIISLYMLRWLLYFESRSSISRYSKCLATLPGERSSTDDDVLLIFIARATSSKTEKGNDECCESQTEN